MKNLIIITLILLWSVFTISNANSTQYINSTNYELVYVTSYDTLWTIAASKVDNKTDIRALISVIIKLNNLNNNAQIYPGQTLKVPVMNGD